MPEQLGHYTLLERVGAGGLGTAFRARDTASGRTVLVKNAAETVAPDPSTRANFLTDARAAATVSHPNVATLFEVGEGDGELFLVYEFVPGETLDRAYEGALDIRRAVDLGIQLAEALGAAHARGVLHLDLRPANVRVTFRGNAKLLGTGLSAWSSGGGGEGERAAAYRSPEQRRGGSVDHRSDLYSLGVILFELLAGRLPDDGTPSGRPGESNPAVPDELDAIIARAMAERAEDRYQSAVPLVAELRSLAAILAVRSGDREPPSLVPPGRTPEKQRRGGRWFRLFG